MAVVTRPIVLGRIDPLGLAFWSMVRLARLLMPVTCARILDSLLGRRCKNQYCEIVMEDSGYDTWTQAVGCYIGTLWLVFVQVVRVGGSVCVQVAEARAQIAHRWRLSRDCRVFVTILFEP